MQIKPKFVTAFFLLVLLTACAAPSYQVPPPSDVSISRAVTEINSARNRPAKSVSMAEANAAVEGVMHRLKPKAQSLCNYLAERSSASCSQRSSLLPGSRGSGMSKSLSGSIP